MNKIKILLEIKHRLADKYGVEGELYHEDEKLVVNDVGTPNAPLILEEVGEIIKEVASKFGVEDSSIAYSTNRGNIVVGFSSN